MGARLAADDVALCCRNKGERDTALTSLREHGLPSTIRNQLLATGVPGHLVLCLSIGPQVRAPDPIRPAQLEEGAVMRRQCWKRRRRPSIEMRDRAAGGGHEVDELPVEYRADVRVGEIAVAFGHIERRP